MKEIKWYSTHSRPLQYFYTHLIHFMSTLSTHIYTNMLACKFYYQLIYTQFRHSTVAYTQIGDPFCPLGQCCRGYCTSIGPLSISQPKSDGVVSSKSLTLTSYHYSVSLYPQQSSVSLLYNKRTASSLPELHLITSESLLTLPELASLPKGCGLSCTDDLFSVCNKGSNYPTMETYSLLGQNVYTVIYKTERISFKEASEISEVVIGMRVVLHTVHRAMWQV